MTPLLVIAGQAFALALAIVGVLVLFRVFDDDRSDQ
jgi:hypothetical protein